jgi:hypothetical protein
MLALLAAAILEQPTWVMTFDAPIRKIDASVGCNVIAAEVGQTIQYRRPGQPETRYSIGFKEEESQGFDLSPGGKKIGVLTEHVCRIYDVAGKIPMLTITPSDTPEINKPYLVAFTPDEKKLLIVQGSLYHNWLGVYDVATGKRERWLLEDVDSRASQIVFTGNGHYGAIDLPEAKGARAPQISVFRMSDGKVIGQYSSAPEWPDAFGFGGDKLFVAEADSIGTFRIEPKPLATRAVKPFKLEPKANRRRGTYQFVPGSYVIATPSDDHVQITGDTLVHRVGGEGRGKITSFFFADGARVLLAREDGKLEMWTLPWQVVDGIAKHR